MQANSVIYLQYTVYDVSPEKERERTGCTCHYTQSGGFGDALCGGLGCTQSKQDQRVAGIFFFNLPLIIAACLFIFVHIFFCLFVY